MADLSDVTAYLLGIAAGAVYPNGTAQPSVSGSPVRLFEGWPIAAQLDKDIAAGTANVSVFPMAGTGRNVYQLLNEPYILVPPVYGLTPSLAGTTVTLTGTPGAEEYLTIIAGQTHIYSRGGASAADILAAIAADAIGDYPSVSATSSSITFPTDDLQVNIGAVGTLARVIHRQVHCIIVTIWASTPAARNTLAAAVDVAMKQNTKVTLPDTTQAVITYDRALQNDTFETVALYRRDLYYNVEYATIEQFPGYVITSVTTEWQSVDPWGNIAPAANKVLGQ